MKPSVEQVRAEIATLKAMKPKIRRRTAFGDDNHAAVDAQISVLEDRLCEDAIYDRWDMDERLLDNALYAYNWLVGDEAGPMSEDWEPLVRG